MATDLTIPSVGESISEAQVGRWLVEPGQFVERDEPVVELETDKVTVELPAPVSGRVIEIIKKQGEKAEIGEVIGRMEEGGKEQDDKEQKQEKTEEKPQEKAPPKAKPREEVKEKEPEPVAPKKREAAPPPAKAAEPADAEPTGDEEVVPLTPIRKRIAQRLVEAQQTAALLTTFNEVDMANLLAIRKQVQEVFQSKHGVKLGFMSFFVKAAIEALKLFPALNAEIRGDNVVYRNYYNLGIAVSTDKGLVVPVLRHAERMSFADIEKSIATLADRARDGKLTMPDLEAGTFTITNGGVFGSLLSTPIINPPQSGILGMHAIQQRPVARAGQVVLRPMMYLALTYDHRIVDGREAVLFLKRVAELIEDPTRMLLEI